MAEGGIIIADVSVTPGRGIYTLKFVIQILGLLTVRDEVNFSESRLMGLSVWLSVPAKFKAILPLLSTSRQLYWFQVSQVNNIPLGGFTAV